MSLEDIKNNLDNLDKLDNNTLIGYIYELSMAKKRSDNKVISLKTQLKYYDRYMKKLQEMINKAIIHTTEEILWNKEEKNE